MCLLPAPISLCINTTERADALVIDETGLIVRI